MLPADFENFTKITFINKNKISRRKMSNFRIVKKLIESLRQRNVIIVRNVMTKRRVEPPKIERQTQSQTISTGGYLLLVRNLIKYANLLIIQLIFIFSLYLLQHLVLDVGKYKENHGKKVS
jgi:hypothetical protein